MRIMVGAGWAVLAIRLAHHSHLHPGARIDPHWVPDRVRATVFPGGPSARYFRLLDEHTLTLGLIRKRGAR